MSYISRWSLLVSVILQISNLEAILYSGHFFIHAPCIRLSRWAGLFILYIHLRAWKLSAISRISSSYRRYRHVRFFYLISLPEECNATTRSLAYIDNFAMELYNYRKFRTFSVAVVKHRAKA